MQDNNDRPVQKDTNDKISGKKKNVVIVGLVALAVLIIAVVVVLFSNKSSEPEPGAEETGVDSVEQVFSLADIGLDEDATNEEIEARLVELGLNYVEGDDSGEDVASEDYCGDGLCNDDTTTVKMIDVAGDQDVFKNYTDTSIKFINTIIETYFSTAFPNCNSIKISKGDDLGSFVLASDNGKNYEARVLVAGSEESREVTKIMIYDETGSRELFFADSSYFEY